MREGGTGRERGENWRTYSGLVGSRWARGGA